MTVDQSHPTLTQRLVCQGALLALFAGSPLVAQAQLGPTTLRALEAQAGIPDGSTPIAQAAPAPATPGPATTAVQAANGAAAPTPAQAGGAATPPPPLKPEPIDWANFTAPQSDEERRLEAVKAKKIADMRALLGTNTTPAKAVAKASAPQKPAKDAEATPYDAQLAAIRDALIEKALQGPTRVVSTAWIDDQGRLHEDAQMTNDMRVRGVRVLNYTANGKAAIKADVDMQAPTSRPLNRPPLMWTSPPIFSFIANCRGSQAMRSLMALIHFSDSQAKPTATFSGNFGGIRVASGMVQVSLACWTKGAALLNMGSKRNVNCQ